MKWNGSWRRCASRSRRRAKADRGSRRASTARIVLVNAEGIELSLGARVTLGRVVLAKFGPAAHYAAEYQFILDRTDEGWFVEACPVTPNDTLVNGKLLADRVPLSIGDRIAIGKAASGKTVLELTVREG